MFDTKKERGKMEDHGEISSFGGGTGVPGISQLGSCDSTADMLSRARVLMQVDEDLQQLQHLSATATSGSNQLLNSNGINQNLASVHQHEHHQCSESINTSMVINDGHQLDEFRRTLEFIVGCFEYDVITKSEVFRDLIETFLCPAFHSLQMTPLVPKRHHASRRHRITPSIMAVPMMIPQPPPPPSPSQGITNFTFWNSTATSSATAIPMTPIMTPTSSVYQGATQGNFTSCDCKSKGKNQNLRKEKRHNGDSLSCSACWGLLVEPVTLVCGHSYCRKCLQKETIGGSCHQCGDMVTQEDIQHRKVNVLISSLVEKWWPTELKAAHMRHEGVALFEKNLVEQALEKLNQVLDLTPNDHLALSNRSHVLLTLGRSEEALRDAEDSIRLCPRWLKGYFRKSAALISLGRYEDALMTLITCIYLMKLATDSWTSKTTPRAQIMSEVVKVVQKIFSQVMTSIPGGGGLQSLALKKKKRDSKGDHEKSDALRFCPYPRQRLSLPSGKIRQRRYSISGVGMTHTGMTQRCPGAKSYDSESNSSSDEVDPEVDVDVDVDDKVGGQSLRRYAIRSGSYIRQQCANHRSSMSSCDPFAFQLDLLTQRMKRLLRNANQELRAFEHRLQIQSSNSSSTLTRRVDPEVMSANDLECSLCYRLLFQPVSTCCGHTFCRSCLERCLDHNPCCPLCKNSLETYLANRDHAVTDFLEVTMKLGMAQDYDERLNQHLEELNSSACNPLDLDMLSTSAKEVDLPIFVCTMAYPTIPCPLHVFEPRYRLMIRRCVENGSNRFGMCCYLSEAENNYGDVGTLLEIRNIQYFADGRSVVYTTGCRRFRVLKRSQVDGYNAGRIELLRDSPIPEAELEDVRELHNQVLGEAKEWLESVGESRRQRIHSHFGAMPIPEQDWISSVDGPSWIWWLLAILPLESKAQLAILGMTSLSKRLSCMSKVLKIVTTRMSAIAE